MKTRAENRATEKRRFMLQDANTPATSDEALRELFTQTQCIAVVGIKAGEQDDAFRVPRYMQQQGYRIVPVNPKLEQVLGESGVASLGQIDGSVYLVNLFRAADKVPAHVDEILAMNPRPKAVWMQLGIVCSDSARRLRQAGIHVIQDRCIMVDHKRVGTE